MQVVIIEDEAPAFRRLQKILEEVDPTIEIIEVLDSVEEGIKWLNDSKQPDLIFMDIQLSDGLSFEIFDAVKITCPVIFTTAFDEYTLRAFKVNSIDYLLKPIKKEELSLSLKKLDQLKSSFKEKTQPQDINALIRAIKLDDRKFKSRFLVKKADELHSVETAEISHFCTRNGVVHLVTQKGKDHIMDFTLDELMLQVDPEQFYRANRQYIVHFKAIQKVHKFHKGKLLIELVLETDDSITVSAEKASDFKGWLGYS
ncbi:MAG: LytTR family DNA-binding domain-containing protein [Bacteroidota bacterium]